MFGALIGRNFPIIRTLISLPIGIMHLSFWKFLLFTTIGSIPWTFAFVYVGFTLGNNWVVLSQYVAQFKTPIRLLLLFFILRFFIKKWREKSSLA